MLNLNNIDLVQRARNVHLLVLDVDGVKKHETKVDDILDLFTSISIECGN